MIKTWKIANIFLVLYFGITMLYYYSDMVIFRGISYIIGNGCLIYMLYKQPFLIKKTGIFVYSILLLAGVNMLVLQMEYYSIFNVLAALGISLLILLYGRVNLIKWIMLLISLHFIYFVISYGGAMDFFPNRSHNHVSAVLVPLAALAIFYDYILYLSIRRSTVAFCLISTLAVFMAVGRSGIISMSVIMLGVVIFLFKIRGRNLIYVALLSILVYFVTTSEKLPFLEYLDFSRFVARGLESETRGDLIEQYIANLDLKSLVFGLERESVSYSGGHNVHNSFLEIHERLGLGILIIAYMLVYTFLKLWKIAVGLALVYLAVMIRASTDTILLFSGFYAGVLFLFSFYMLKIFDTERNYLGRNL